MENTNIPTAEELLLSFLTQNKDLTIDEQEAFDSFRKDEECIIILKAMEQYANLIKVEYAKQCCKEQLEAILEKATVRYNDELCFVAYVDEDSITTAYDIDNLKPQK